MSRHEEFLTEDYSFYAAECKRMAELARAPKSHAARTFVTFPRWADRVSRIAVRHRQPQESY